MYNNEVTYDPKWDTEENKAAFKKLDEKFFDKSVCSPSCPNGWAPEVLELLETIEKEYGIVYNTSTIRAYYVQGKPFDHFITGPFKNAWNSFYSNFIETIDPEKTWQVERRNKPVTTRLKKVFDSALDSIRYGKRAFRITHINPILNKIYKPKVVLSQVKEKYGELRIYYSAPEHLEPIIEKMIAKTEVKLALKGCYYPVESLWRAGSSRWVGTDSHPDIIETKEKTDSQGEKYIEVFTSSHRTAMKELGIDLKDMEQKYQAFKKKRDDEIAEANAQWQARKAAYQAAKQSNGGDDEV